MSGGCLSPGCIVLIYLQEPREKIWGLLLDLNPAGVLVRGLALTSFDDWLREAGTNTQGGIRPSTTFYPLGRVEKIILDEPGEGVPSLDEQCRARTGKGLEAHLAQAAGAGGHSG